MAETLIQRNCPACEQTDDAPKHVIVIADGSPNGAELGWHKDCHAAVGCDECKFLLNQTGAKKNDELREALSSLPPIEVVHEETGTMAASVNFVDQTAANSTDNMVG